MLSQRHLARLAAAALLAASLPGPAADIKPVGARPGYAKDADLTVSVPNQAAITAKIWAPGLDDGYDPQGLTVAGGAVLVSSYKEKQPCRIYRLDPQTGKVTGQFDLKTCHHGGGLAYAGKEGDADILVVADTRRLFKIDMTAAFKAGSLEPGKSKEVLGYLDLGGALTGSFVDFDSRGKNVFIGTYVTKAKLQGGAVNRYLIPYSLFETANGTTLDDKKCEGCSTPDNIKLAADAQGAAYDNAGTLWFTTSSSQFGCLHRAGSSRASFQMVAAVEDIGFDSEGRLWAVSESGSKKYWSDPKWATRFPFVFRVDVAKLKPVQNCS